MTLVRRILTDFFCFAENLDSFVINLTAKQYHLCLSNFKVIIRFVNNKTILQIRPICVFCVPQIVALTRSTSIMHKHLTHTLYFCQSEIFSVHIVFLFTSIALYAMQRCASARTNLFYNQTTPKQ
jgi:hypothetical protein